MLIIGCASAVAQNQDRDEDQNEDREPPTEELTIAVEPEHMTLEIGDTHTLVATVRDSAGDVVKDVKVVFYSRGAAQRCRDPGG